MRGILARRAGAKGLMEFVSILLGVVVGFLGALLLLRLGLLSGQQVPPAAKAVATREVVVQKPAPKRAAVALSSDYEAQHVYAAAVERAAQEVLRTAAEIPSSWQQFANSDGVTMSQKDVDGQNVPLIRGDAVIPAPPLGLLELIRDRENARTFDPSLRRVETLECLDDQSNAVYADFKGLGPISGRDFCTVEHHRQVPEGLLCVSTSVEHPRCGEVQSRGLVRARTPYNGWLLRPADGGACSVTYVANIDLGGSLPTRILRKVAKEAAGKVLELKRLAADRSTGADDEPAETGRALAGRGRAAVEQLESDASPGGWDEVMTKHEIRIFRKRGSLHKFKGEGVIRMPPEEVQRVLLDVGLSSQWDGMCREAGVVERVDDSTRVVYLRYRARKCLMTSSRDLCVVHSHALREDGTFVLAGASVEHPKCPPRADTVRAELSCGGWIVRSAAGGQHSHVTYVVQIDARGGVPERLLREVAMRVPLSIHYLGEWLMSRRR